jgi:hypothetical protein
MTKLFNKEFLSFPKTISDTLFDPLSNTLQRNADLKCHNNNFTVEKHITS